MSPRQKLKKLIKRLVKTKPRITGLEMFRLRAEIRRKGLPKIKLPACFFTTFNQDCYFNKKFYRLV